MSFAKPFFAVALGALLWPVACSNQGEGQRCDWRNGNDDCESGLECIRVSQLSGATASVGDAALCCPHDPLAAKVDACLRVGQLIGADAGSDGAAGAEASTGGSSSTDAGKGG